MAAAFSSTLYMYDAIRSTFGSENKLCRVVNCKSGMAALNALVCGQFRSMCSSVWISPQGHRRASLGILLHLPVSIFSLCEDSLSHTCYTCITLHHYRHTYYVCQYVCL